MPPELNNSTETQEISDEQKFLNLLDSEEATPDEDERAEEVAESTEEVDEDVDETDEQEDEDEVEEESSETEPEAGDAEEEYIFNVSIDGEDTEVNHNELIKGYQRQSDYTRKTQSLADDRKGFEEQKAQLAQERQQVLAMLQKQQTTNNGELDKFNNVDWAELKEYEPDKYLMMREEQREAVTNIQTQQQEQDRLAQAQQQDFGVQMQRYLAEEDAKLVDQIDGWGNPESKKAVQSDIASYAKQVGYSDEELGNLADSRALLLMHKARLYDQMQGSGKNLVSKKKAKAVRRVVSGGKPATNAQKESKRAADLRSRAKQSGSVDDAAAAFMDML
tara:strand:- start:546 stop:1547 length:1002 start_codon:yes stop_codon:yes gene_type:complete